MTATTADDIAAGTQTRLTYRPHLDGLRAVAVALVVAFHAGLERFLGGFIGVDVFFVLSGFLVTRILLQDLIERDRVQWRQFYGRRARRILPAALATLVFTALAYAAVATPAERLNALGGFRAAFLYVANWHFINDSTNYFAPDVTSSPVLHFWSLAVEEQFYLLWPLVLGALWVLSRPAGRARWWALRGVIVVVACASAIAAVHIGATNIDRAYYGTDTRAYQLLVGALLALTPQLFYLGRKRLAGRAGRWGATLGLTGILVVSSSAIDVSAVTRGLLATAFAATLIVLLETASGGFAKAALSSRPLVYLGRISYGIYLWHWPVTVLVRRDRAPSPIELFVIAAAFSTALAAISFHMLEHPIRTWRTLDRYKGPVIAVGLALSVAGGVLLTPLILDVGNTSIAGGKTAGRTSGLRLLDWRVAEQDIPPLPDCLRKPVDRCTIVRGHGLRVLLMGDSNARMWIPTFRHIARRQSWTLSVAAFPDCPWQRDLQYARGPVSTCRAHQTDWYQRVVPELDPDVILLAHQAFDDPVLPIRMIGPDGQDLRPVAPGRDQILGDVTDAALRALHRSGRRIVILEPIPQAPVYLDPLACLSQTRAWSECSYDANRVPTRLEQHDRIYARNHADDVVSLDLDHVVCPRWPTCDPVVRNIIVKRDRTHITATFARSVDGLVEQRLVRAGVLGKKK